MTTCAIDTCGRPHEARGWCHAHYVRWLKTGDVRADVPLRRWRADPLDRWLDLIPETPLGECWLWSGKVDKFGYPQFWDGETMVKAHRWGYERLVERIPDGLTLDHVCHSRDLTCPGGPCLHRSCVNPDHVEPVTMQVNRLRSHQAGGWQLLPR